MVGGFLVGAIVTAPLMRYEPSGRPLPAEDPAAGHRRQDLEQRPRLRARYDQEPMARISGDPGPIRWLAFAFGFRLPEDNIGWVQHELTDAGWRFRTVLRHLAIIIPLCLVVAAALLTLLPAPAWLAGMMVGLVLAGSVFTTVAYADDLRASRLRQHGLEPPDDPDLGRPAH